jgi:hypothetical protein
MNAQGRKTSAFAKATADRLRHEEYSHEKAQNAQKKAKNDQKMNLFGPQPLVEIIFRTTLAIF